MYSLQKKQRAEHGQTDTLLTTLHHSTFTTQHSTLNTQHSSPTHNRRSSKHASSSVEKETMFVKSAVTTTTYMDTNRWSRNHQRLQPAAATITQLSPSCPMPTTITMTSYHLTTREAIPAAGFALWCLFWVAVLSYHTLPTVCCWLHAQGESRGFHP